MKRLLSVTCIVLCLAANQVFGAVGLRLAFEPATLDWNLGDVPIHVINNVVEGLYSVNESGTVIPCEAIELPKRAAKPGRWRIRLRGGLKWSDGKPVRAQDYLDSWRRLLDPKTASTYSYLLFEFAGARELNSGKTASWDGVRAVSDTELEVRLRNTAARVFPAAALTHWATFPIRADLIAANPNWTTRPATMAFNGPYKITSYQPEVKLDLVPNPEHRKPGTLDRIEALIVQDDSTALRLYESGRLHFVADLGTLDRASLTRRSDYRSMKSPVLVYLGIAAADPLLSARELRHALSDAIDRSAFPRLLASACVPTSDLTPTASSGARKLSDPEAARRSGSALRGKKTALGYFEKGTNRTVSEFIQAQWKSVLGISAELQGSEVKSYWKKLAQKPYPVFLNTFGPPVWDARYYFELLLSGNPMNMGRWSDKSYDKAVEAGDLDRAEAIVRHELPIIPLYFRAYDYLVSPKLKGARVNPMTSLYLDQAALEP